MNKKKHKDLPALTGSASNAMVNVTHKIRDKVGLYLLNELCTDYELSIIKQCNKNWKILLEMF